jgi:Fic family protein
MSFVEQATQRKRELDAMRPLAPNIERRVLEKLRLDWNYHSNHLEGNQLDYGETKALLLHGITAQGKPLRDHLEIRGHNEAIALLLDLARNNSPLSQSDLRNLHKTILGEPYDVDAITPAGFSSKKRVVPGEYKTQSNHVLTATGEVFHFAEPFEVASKMTELMDWLDKQRALATSNPILVAATFHYEFVRIHPFDDGNGRMARLLMNLELMRAGFPPAVIRTEEKDAYFSALRQADGGNLAAFAEHIAERVDRSLSTMLAAAKGESIDEPNDLDKKLFLLEQEFKSNETFNRSARTSESIRRVFEHVYAPFVTRLNVIAGKFRRFYESTVETIYDGTATSFAWDAVTQAHIREQINESTKALSYSLVHSEPKFAGPPQFGVYFEIYLNRNDFRLIVSTNAASGKTPFPDAVFGYDELPDSNLLSSIADRLANLHVEIIDAAKNSSG